MSAPTRRRWRRVGEGRCGRALPALLLALATSAATDGGPLDWLPPAHAARGPEEAHRLLQSWRTEEAEREIAALIERAPKDPLTAFLDGALRFELGDYEGAARRLETISESKEVRGALAEEAKELGALASATAAATRGFVEARSVEGHFVLRHPPGRDALLVGPALAALERAYAAIGEDFGERPPRPVRVEIYPEVADLAQVSTLTIREIETSGTIALCKFNRLMIVSPRALAAGYPWLDTLTHEYTHYVVSRVSHDTVPIWLHEGLAKFEEKRWHLASGGGLSPASESLLANALQHKRLIGFDKMHPSMAKLPSQEDAALAFAEVYTAVDYLHGKVGWAGLRRLMERLRAGGDLTTAITEVTGRSFAAFEADWRAWLQGRKLRARPGLRPRTLRFRKATDGPQSSEDEAAEITEDRARSLTRLGGLLRARKRLRAAAIEYQKAEALVGAGHPIIGSKLARTYVELGDSARAIEVAGAVAERYPDLAGPNAILGAGLLERGKLDEAGRYLEAALAVSPFDPAIRCGLERVYRARHDARAGREGEACRQLSDVR